MCRISQSIAAGRFTRKFLAAATLALIAAAALSLGAPPTIAGNDGEGSNDNTALKIDIGCAQRDLDLVTLIERNGNSGLSTTATLVETSDLLQTARAACSVGDVDNALALYDTALRRLENPSDVARR